MEYYSCCMEPAYIISTGSARIRYYWFSFFACRPENMWYRAGKMLEGRLIPMVHSVF